MPLKRGKGFSFRAEAGRAEIFLYDVIDPYFGLSAQEFSNELKALGEVTAIDLRINSPGGSITEGMAIHSILKRHPAAITAHVDGVAASMASVVAMAAEKIIVAEGSYMMIHNPLGAVYGEADEMRDYAELLDKMKGQIVNIYANRTKQSAEAIAKFMDADTWFTPEEAIAAGFADGTSPELALAASIDPNLFKNLPQKLRGEARMSKEPETTAVPPTPPAPPQLASYADLKTGLPGADADFICKQLEAQATIGQAQSSWMAEQNRRIEAARAQATEAEAKVAAANVKKPGVDTLGNGTGTPPQGNADPIGAFAAAVAAKLATGMARAKAVSAVTAENPELHAEYLDAYNAERKKK